MPARSLLSMSQHVEIPQHIFPPTGSLLAAEDKVLTAEELTKRDDARRVAAIVFFFGAAPSFAAQRHSRNGVAPRVEREARVHPASHGIVVDPARQPSVDSFDARRLVVTYRGAPPPSRRSERLHGASGPRRV